MVTDSAGNQGTDSKTVVVGNERRPTINWTNPADIVYGTMLTNAAILDATSSWTVGGTLGSDAGNFVYTPAAGAILHAGQNQLLSVTFTPTDMTDYTSASQTAFINVQKAGISYTIANDSHVYGTTDSFSDANGLDDQHGRERRERLTSPTTQRYGEHGHGPRRQQFADRRDGVQRQRPGQRLHGDADPRRADGDAVRIQLHDRQ